MNGMLRLPRSKRWHALIFCAALASSASCSDPTAPLDPTLSGTWVQTGLDTYDRFILQKRGSRVIGSHDAGVVYGPSMLAPVRGAVSGGLVVLKWEHQGSAFTFTAPLPAAQAHELTGYMSYNGERAASPETFVRVTSAYPPD